MNQFGATTPPPASVSLPDATSGEAIVARSNLAPEQENALLRQQLSAIIRKNREQARIISEHEEKISEQTLALRRESQARYVLEMKLQLSELVSDNVERILTDLNRIEVTDTIGFFDYLMNQLPEELDCGIRYFIPPSTLDMDVRVQNGKKSDIFVELLDRSYAEIQIIRKSKGLPVMENVLFHDMPKWEDMDQRELFPIQIDDETVGHIEFMREKGARKLVPDIRPQFHRVMRLISSHLDRMRYETIIRENERILQENMSLLRAELHTDVLTGVSNRRGFFAKTERMLMAYPNLPATLIAIDIDYFKRINDTYWHAGGDSALRAVAQNLKAMLGTFMLEHQSEEDRKHTSADTVERRNTSDKYELGRLGGEEFAIQIVGIEYSEVQKFAEALRLSIRDEFREFRNGRSDMEPTAITISVGVAKFTERLNGETVEGWQARILDNADAGLYHAKHNGRNQVMAFEKISLEVLEKRKLEAELKNNTVIPLRSGAAHASGEQQRYRPVTTHFPHAEAIVAQSRIRSRIKKANRK